MSSNIDIWEQAEPGVRSKIFPIGKSIMMMEVHFEPEAGGLEHSHPHEQLIYCIKGCMEFIVDGSKHIIAVGETVYIPSDMLHSAKALETSIILVSFTPIREDLVK